MKVDEMQGRWVRRGMVWRSTAPRPADEPDPERVILANLKYRCSDCGGAVSRRDVVRCHACRVKWWAANRTSRQALPKATCSDCGRECSAKSKRCRECADKFRAENSTKPAPVGDPIELLTARLATNFAQVESIDTRPLIGVICEACGCLCAVDEDCPGCRVWARDREAEANRRHTHERLWTEAA